LAMNLYCKSRHDVLLDLKIFAACNDLWGGPPGPQPTPSSAQLWLRLCCSVEQIASLQLKAGGE
jgi:hypothetical protein